MIGEIVSGGKVGIWGFQSFGWSYLSKDNYLVAGGGDILAVAGRYVIVYCQS